MPLTDAELIERMNRRMPPTSALLGMTVLAVDRAAGTVRLRFTPKPEFGNPMGNVQGGFIVAMLDDAAALAAIVTSGTRIAVPTIELKASFFGPAKLGAPLLCRGALHQARPAHRLHGGRPARRGRHPARAAVDERRARADRRPRPIAERPQ